MERQFTPDNITRLGPDEIFVFGSNLQGNHRGGAARVALERFGAVPGVGVGLQGQSYAIPTMHGGVETIKPYVDQFIRMARLLPQLTFYVTRIGCGIAGFKDSDIAPLFNNAYDLENVILPETFASIIATARRYESEFSGMKFKMQKIKFYPEDMAKMEKMPQKEKMQYVQWLRQNNRYIVVDDPADSK